MIYEFTCDARVIRRIQAATKQEAQKKWEGFCAAANFSEYFLGTPCVGTFRLILLDGVPEIERIDPKSISLASQH